MSRPPLPLWCGSCDPIGRLVQVTEDTAQRCPRCNPMMMPGGRHDAEKARQRRRERRALGTTSATCPECGDPVVRSHRCRATARRVDA